ncbi:hypothetical protein RGCCGE502_18605 [Rhizobium grahamii CCGE 502]|uniref:Uncharacterized protein n=1 Tax=Rhizobium grahamii CCGE 502 TaxID=990285 RepID=S3IBU2_9HYPH|nr:hypothetical protein RGCCGE502_18605 [Rhizobium grahamii CCGE 502]
MHPLASTAAEVSEYAGSRGLFWQINRSIFANQHRLSVSLLIALASELKLSPIALRDALASGTFVEKVREDFIGVVRGGVNGTPTFFVNGVRHDGPYGALSLAINQAILAAA